MDQQGNELIRGSAAPPSVPLPEFLRAANRAVPGRQGPPELLRYLTLLRRHRAMLLLIAGFGAGAGVALTNVQTPVYRATGTVEIHIANENYLNLRDVNPTAPATYYPEYDLQTQIRVLSSRDIAKRVVERVAEAPPAGFAPVEDRWGRFLSTLRLGPARSFEWRDLVHAASSSFRVKAVPNSRVLELTAEAPDARAAAAYINGVAGEFINAGLESRLKSNLQTGDWLNGQLSELKSRLAAGEAKLLDYSSREGLVMTGSGKEKDNVADAKLLQLQRELTAAHTDRVAKQARFEAAASAAGGPLPETVESDLLRIHHENLAELRRQYAELTATMKPTHYKVIKVQDQITVLEKELAEERKQVVGRVKSDFDAAVRREDLLLEDYQAQTVTARDQAAKTTYYDLLRREVDATRNLYDSLLHKVKEAAVAAALRSPGSRIIDDSEPPGAPFQPDWRRNLATGLAGGLALGLALVLAREQLTAGFHQPGDIAMTLRIPELGVVPSSASGSASSLVRLGSALSHELTAHGPVELALKDNSKSLLAESVRGALTSILTAARINGQEPRVIIVTSAGAGEGKTTLVCNLAIAFAEAGRRTVLVDADMRRPRIHGVFGLGNDQGLTTELRATDPSAPLAVSETPVPGLFVLPSGPRDPAMGNLLHSSRMPALMARLRQSFDIVLIDTPPALLVADARIIGSHADGAVFLIRASDTSRESASAALNRLEQDGIKVLGAVLNAWDPKGGSYYGYRSYDRYYSRTYGKG